MKRVMIIGQPGAGKSTLARELGNITHLPIIHIDKIHWKPGWVERSAEEKSAICSDIHDREKWIFEGGHSLQRLDRADTLIWLDFPLPIRAARVAWRTLRDYGQSRPDLPEDCPEQFDPEFWRWIWNTRHSAAAKMAKLYASASNKKARHRLRNKSEVQAYLSALRDAVAVGNLGVSHR